MEKFSEFEKDYFDAYSYDTIWSLAYMYQSKLWNNQSNTEIFKKTIENIDFLGATVSKVGETKILFFSKEIDYIFREESGF